MIKDQYFFQSLSFLCTLFLLVATPTSSVTVGNKKNSDIALIVVNGQIMQRQITEQSMITIPVSSMGAIKSASVMTKNVQCYFHVRKNCYFDPTAGGSDCVALRSDGRYSQSTISPVFGRNYDLVYSDESHFYNALSCYKVPDGSISILLENEFGRSFQSNVYSSLLDENDQVKIDFKGSMVKDLLKATLLATPYPDLRCKILGSDMFVVDIKLGQPYPSNIPGARQILCKREKDWA